MAHITVSSEKLRRWTLLALFVAAVAGGWFVSIGATAADTIAAPQLTGPKPQDRQITIAVSLLLRRGHLSGHPLDDEMSERCLSTFLKTLDPLKVYFYQSDVDVFMEKQGPVRRPDQAGRHQLRLLRLQRAVWSGSNERVKTIDEILAQDQDFTVDEDMIVDPDVAEYPANAADARERWRKRIKYDLLVQKADGKADEESKTRLTRRYHSFAKRMHQTDHDELLEMYLTVLTTGYDPHTTYMSPKTLENFEISMRLELEGIGAALQSLDGDTVVSKVIPGGAADKDGRLKEQDRIVGVGQDTDGEIVDVVDMKLPDVVEMIRGKEGTVVRLQVIPVGATTPIEYHITRAKIELTDSEARGEIVEQAGSPGGPTTRSASSICPASTWTWTGPGDGFPISRAPPATSRKSSMISTPRESTRWSSTCAATAAARSPRRST